MQATDVARVAQHQGRGQHGLLQQLLIAIAVQQDLIEQARPLRHPVLEGTPFVSTDDAGQDFE